MGDFVDQASRAVRTERLSDKRKISDERKENEVNAKWIARASAEKMELMCGIRAVETHVDKASTAATVVLPASFDASVAMRQLRSRSDNP